MSMNGFGSRVKEKRISEKMTQEELALKVGYTSLSKKHRKKRCFSYMVKMSGFYIMIHTMQ